MDCDQGLITIVTSSRICFVIRIVVLDLPSAQITNFSFPYDSPCSWQLVVFQGRCKCVTMLCPLVGIAFCDICLLQGCDYGLPQTPVGSLLCFRATAIILTMVCPAVGILLCLETTAWVVRFAPSWQRFVIQVCFKGCDYGLSPNPSWQLTVFCGHYKDFDNDLPAPPSCQLVVFSGCLKDCDYGLSP